MSVELRFLYNPKVLYWIKFKHKQLKINKIHHIAIICSNYEASKKFYTDILGFKIKEETYRAERASYKLDLMLNDEYIIELFSFPNPVPRPTRPEAMGLRHLAFEVNNLDESIEYLEKKGVHNTRDGENLKLIRFNLVKRNDLVQDHIALCSSMKERSAKIKALRDELAALNDFSSSLFTGLSSVFTE